ncbi:MAG: DsbE family thiol:disulfide interchange protein [Gammaproteobacteria bacterium]|nr:DsbE family thiol:disulfide interchange protein [Gammaproteobacteria bacterium]
MLRWVGVAIGGLLLLLVALGLGLQKDPKLIPSPLINQPLPELTGFDLDENRVKIGGLGLPRIINVWASWCVACRTEHPFLMEAVGGLSGQVELIGLNYKDKPEAARQWLDQLGDPYLWSLQDPNGRAGLELGVYGVPETFFVDRAGVIRHKQVGPLTANSLEQGLQMITKMEAAE